VIEDFIGRIQARERKLWSFYWILLQKNPEQPVLIGSGGFLAHKDGTLEIGYSLLPGYYGKGYATEAVQSMVQWASSSLKRESIIASIIAYTYPHLKASISVLEKNGFLLKGKGPEEGTITYEFLNGNKNSILSSREIQIEEVFTEKNLSTSINSHNSTV
jgi:[ribosomal protein S5]-alanine N-acetyltransferase